MDILSRIFKKDQTVTNLSDDDKNVLIASILFECVRVDGESSTDEMDRVKFILKNKLNLEEEVLTKNFDIALDNTNKSIEIYSLTREIREKFDRDEILKIFEYMWEIILIDGNLDDFEAALMRNAAGLFHISGKESAEAKKKLNKLLKIKLNLFSFKFLSLICKYLPMLY